jgi:hypothetical protein
MQAVRRVLLQEDDDAGFDDAPPVRTSKKPCQAQSFAASCHQVTSPAASPHESMAELSFRVHNFHFIAPLPTMTWLRRRTNRKSARIWDRKQCCEPCDGVDRPAPDSPQNPDSPSGHLAGKGHPALAPAAS